MPTRSVRRRRRLRSNRLIGKVAFTLGEFDKDGPPSSLDETNDIIRERLATVCWLGTSAVFSINEYLLTMTGQKDVFAKAKEGIDLINEYSAKALKTPYRTSKARKEL